MTDDELLADLLLRWEELHEQGQEPGAEELCRDYPHLAPRLAERIRALKVTAWMDRPDDDGGNQPDQTTPSIPPTLTGRYRLDEKIAEGGFAEVWKGYDLELRRAVAVKLPKPGRLVSAERFMAEARRVAGLNHPGVVPVFDVGRDGDSCFIVSEFVEGGSLADRIAKDRPSPQEVVRLVAEVAETLAYAHRQGFIHRDIKPANILIDRHGRALLADFGIARSPDDRAESGAISFGTLAYMSTEQVEGQGVDHRSDIYSLGVVLYELLTGQLPHNGTDPVEVRRQIISGNVVQVRAVSKGLGSICLKCLAKKPGDRYATAQELADALTAIPKQARRIGMLKLLALSVALVVVVSGIFVTTSYWPRTPQTTERQQKGEEDELPATVALRSFNLDRSPTTDEGLRQFEGMADLGELRLTETRVTDAGLVLLLGCKHLRFLDLNHLKITDEGLKHLAGLTELRHLGLARTHVTDDGLKHLAGLKKLRHLNLDYTQISDAGLDRLSKLPSLTDLRLTSTPVTDDGLKKLAHLKKLQNLDLHHTQVTDAGLEALADLPDLRAVGVAGTKVSEDWLKRLRKGKR